MFDWIAQKLGFKKKPQAQPQKAQPQKAPQKGKLRVVDRPQGKQPQVRVTNSPQERPQMEAPRPMPRVNPIQGGVDPRFKLSLNGEPQGAAPRIQVEPGRKQPKIINYDPRAAQQTPKFNYPVELAKNFVKAIPGAAADVGVLGIAPRPLARFGASIGAKLGGAKEYKPGSKVEEFLTTPIWEEKGKPIKALGEGEYSKKAGGGAIPVAVLGGLMDSSPLKALKSATVASTVNKSVKAAPKGQKKSAIRAGIEEAVLPVTTTLERNYGKGGVRASKMLRSERDEYERRVGEALSRSKKVLALDSGVKGKIKGVLGQKKDFETMVDYLEGTKKRVPKHIKEAGDEARMILDEIHEEGVKTGLKTFGDDMLRYKKGYFPRVYDDKVFKQGTKEYDTAAKHLVKTKQAPNLSEAQKKLDAIHDSVANSPASIRRSKQLQGTRDLNLPEYKKDKNAFVDYVDTTSRALSEAKHFGTQGGKLQGTVRTMEREGKNVLRGEELIKTARRMDDTGFGKKVVGGVAKYNALTKLGLATIANITQSGNTAATTGIKRTVKAASERSTDEGKEFVERTGVTTGQVLRDVREGATRLSGKASAIGAPGFQKVEKFNRGTAALAGRQFARDMAAKGDERQLAKLGFGQKEISQIKKTGKLTDDQEIRAARNVVERTQFKVDPMDLPAWASSGAGRLVSQFRTFPYKQTGFINDEIIGEAAKGNLAPIARYAPTTAALGPAVGTVRKGILATPDRDESEEDTRRKVLDTVQNAGGVGLYGEAAGFTMPYGDDPTYKTLSLLKDVAGVTGSSVADLTYGAISAAGGNADSLKKWGLRQFSTLGKREANKRYGQAPASERANAVIGAPGAAPDLNDPVRRAQADATATDIQKQLSKEARKKKPDAQKVAELTSRLSELRSVAKGENPQDARIKFELENTAKTYTKTKTKVFYKEIDQNTGEPTGKIASYNVDFLNRTDPDPLKEGKRQEIRDKVAKSVMTDWAEGELTDPQTQEALKDLRLSVPQKDLKYIYIKSLPETGGVRGRAILSQIAEGDVTNEANKDTVNRLIHYKVISKGVVRNMHTYGEIDDDTYRFLYNALSSVDKKYKDIRAGGDGSGSASGKGSGTKKLKSVNLPNVPKVSVGNIGKITTDVPTGRVTFKGANLPGTGSSDTVRFPDPRQRLSK